MEYFDADFERSQQYAIRELLGQYGVPMTSGDTTLHDQNERLKAENAELKRKLEKTNTDVDLAAFYQLQAEVALAQTVRASSVLTISTIASWLAALLFIYLAPYQWMNAAWGCIAGILLFYRVASLVWPKKYDNLNVMERRLEVKKAELEVQRAFNYAARSEEASE